MVQTTTRIPLNETSIQKCRCGGCPVQANSSCVKDKEEKLNLTRKKNPLQGQDIPGVYCSSGKATCPDLNPRNPCVCGTCPIFNEDYHLGDNRPAGYFCKGGRAS